MHTIAILVLGTLAGADVAWENDWESARERSRNEQKVLFVSLLHPGESRSDDFLELFDGPLFEGLAEGTVNLSSQAGPQVLATVSETLKLTNEKGVVALPQHLWVDANGEVILSVPYELTPGELAWCFSNATGSAAPSGVDDVRPPRRLVMHGVHKPTMMDDVGRGYTKQELEQHIEEARKSLAGRAAGGWMRIVLTDERLAIEYVQKEIKSGVVTLEGGPDVGWVRMLGRVAPNSYTDLVTPFAKSKDAAVRNETAVALEQMADPEAFKAVKSALGREKDPAVEKNWLRALGATGFGDKGARKTLIKVARDDKDAMLRANAIVALGYVEQDDDVRELLVEYVHTGAERERLAAACAMAFSRDPRYVEVLKEAAGVEKPLAVLEGGNVYEIEDLVKDVCGDVLERPRVFYGGMKSGQSSSTSR